MTTISAKVIADSLSPDRIRLTTMLTTCGALRPDLDELLADARAHGPMTDAEQRAQARSFARGNLAADGRHEAAALVDDAVRLLADRAERPSHRPLILGALAWLALMAVCFWPLVWR